MGSTTGKFDDQALCLQQVEKSIAVVSLDFNNSIFEGAARTAAALQLGGQLFQLFFRTAKAGDQSNNLTAAVLFIQHQPDHTVARGQAASTLWRCGFLFAAAAGDRTPAVRADAPGFGGIDGACI